MILTVYCDYSGYTDEQQVFLQPGDGVDADLVVSQGGGGSQLIGPDGFGYIAIQSGDDHPMAPVYAWIPIDPLEDGDGIRVNMPDEETAVVIDLPFSFTFYDNTYTQITVCENGFFSFGDRSDLEEAADYSNSALPAGDGPPAVVAPFWEDMFAAETNLSYFDNQSEGRFIVEWYNSRQYAPDTAYESFQVILYDPNVYPEHGDYGHIKFQYAQVTDPTECSIGIENEDETIGLTVLQDAAYHQNASAIEAESAIYFYRPFAGVNGQLVLDPSDPETVVTMTVGDMTLSLNEGEFSNLFMIPGFNLITLNADGYESLTFAEDLLEDQSTDLGTITLTRLDVPDEVYYEELNGSFDNGASVYWSEPSQDEIDEFLGQYRVYRNGLLLAQTGEQTYADETSFVEGTSYWVTALYAGGESDSSWHAIYASDVTDAANLMPTEFNVAPPWPNPFNPSTAIRIALPEPANLEVAVYDLLGREVTRLAAKELRQAGYHRLVWDATGHASGMYFVRVNAGPHTAVKKVMLLK